MYLVCFYQDGQVSTGGAFQWLLILHPIKFQSKLPLKMTCWGSAKVVGLYRRLSHKEKLHQCRALLYLYVFSKCFQIKSALTNYLQLDQAAAVGSCKASSWDF